jgi:acyl-CoA thioester hydrolase
MPDDDRSPAPAAFPVEVRFSIHWGEMDALGHVNNARYFTWFESARMALFEHIGLDTGGVPGVGPILAHTSCDFLAPVTYPAEIAAGTRIARLGTTSFTMQYGVTLLSAEPPRLVARGEGVVVLIDYRTGQKVRIPADLRQALEGLG